MVERTIALFNRCRRLAEDWENLNRKALTFLRLGPSASCSENFVVPLDVPGQTLTSCAQVPRGGSLDEPKPNAINMRGTAWHRAATVSGREGLMKTFAAFTSVLALASIAAQSAVADPVRIAFPATSVDFAPAYVAEKIGLFKKANLDVKITVFRGGAAVQEAINADAADLISYFGPAVALAVSKGAKEKFVMAVLPATAGWACIVKTTHRSRR